MTSATQHIRPMACPACVAGPEGALVDAPIAANDIVLALPTIHCAACISGVERALNAIEAVASARVNLTLRRVSIKLHRQIEPDALIEALAVAGFEAQELDASLLEYDVQAAQGRALLMRLGVAGFAMMNVMLLSVAVWSGADAATRDMMHWISAAIALPAVAFCGQPFYASAWTALRAKRLNMDVPIVFAIVLAVVTSLYETALGGHHAYFDAAISLTFFLLAGRYLDHKTRSNARSAAQELSALEVHRALKIVGETEVVVPLAEVSPGDRVRVRPGARVPADGVIVKGESEIDTAVLTGESLPRFVGSDVPVQAGCLNLTGVLDIKVTASASDSALRQIADLVAIAESGRSNYTSLADKAATLYAPGVHILSALSALGWFAFTQDLRIALNIAAAVLIITCPCALGLAVPAVTAAASGRLFGKGVLIKHETALERLAAVDTVVFDKTGTLTTGELVAAKLGELSKTQAGIALSLATGSSHPMAVALTDQLNDAGVNPFELEAWEEVSGYGIQAIWNGKRVRLGRSAWVGAQALGTTATYFRIEGQEPCAISFDDSLRPGVTQSVAALQAKGMRVVLLSGDAPAAVAQLAEKLSMDEYFGGVMPDEKFKIIQRLKAEGAVPMMIGDGLNDTAALSEAHVSGSPASALEAARLASDIVLVSPGLSVLPDLFGSAEAAARRIRENFALATIYNVLAVPLAVAGMATPLIAALAMSASSISVSLNATRLR